MKLVINSLLVTLIAAVVILGLSSTPAFPETELGLHEAAREGNLVTMQKWIEKGADVNGRAKDGSTPLIQASLRGHIDAMKLLLKSGADVNGRDEMGLTPLMYSVGKADAMKLLISKGADVNAKIEAGPLQGLTSLIIAALGEHTEVVKILIAKGADKTNLERDVAEFKAKLAKKNSEYRSRGELMKLKADLKHVYTSAQVILLDKPTSIIATQQQLAKAGCKLSEDIVFVRGDISINSGSIVLRNNKLNEANSIKVKNLRPGEGMIDFKGDLYVPSVK